MEKSIFGSGKLREFCFPRLVDTLDDDDDDIDELLLSCFTVDAANVDNPTVVDNDNDENCWPTDDLMLSCSNELSHHGGSGHSGSIDLAMTCDTDDCSVGQTIIYYLGGYVAHKLKRYTKCLDCLKNVQGTIDNDSPYRHDYCC